MIKCQSCSMEIHKTERFCPHCGTAVPKPDKESFLFEDSVSCEPLEQEGLTFEDCVLHKLSGLSSQMKSVRASSIMQTIILAALLILWFMYAEYIGMF